MTKKMIASLMLAAIVLSAVPALASLDFSYWAHGGSINYSSGTVDFSLNSKPAHPWDASWGKDLSVSKDKVYTLSFDASATFGGSSLPVTVLMHQNYAPYGHYSDEKTLQIDSANRHYEVDLYSVATDARAVLVVWTGNSAGEYHFWNISITEKDPSAVKTYHPLDFTYWANTFGTINRAFGMIDFDVANTPSEPWVASWGHDLAVQKDKIYTLSFDAKADSYAGAQNTPVSLRINQNYSPWGRYSEEKIINLSPTQQHFDIELYSTANDSKAEIAAWVGHARAKYHFENISTSVKDPSSVPNYNPLDGSFWANDSGRITYAFGTIDFDVDQKPANPWEKSWGKDLAVTKDKAYLIKFDAYATGGTGGNFPVSARIHQNYQPFSLYTEEKNLNLNANKQHYEFELYSIASDPKAAFVVWVGQATGNYHFENISITEKDPSAIKTYHPLDFSYWANDFGSINRAFGTVDFDVTSLPAQPWIASWGKDLAVTKDKLYVVEFDAYASSYENRDNTPISMRINQNYSPWSRYSQEKTINLDSAKQHYAIELYSTANDAKSEIGIWVGHSRARYHFENISVTQKDPASIINSNPLDSSWWANGSGNINYAFGTIDFNLLSKPANPFEAAWGRDMAVAAGKRYKLKFDAQMMGSGASSVPVSFRIHHRTAPWTQFSETKTVNISPAKNTYEVELSVNTSDNNAVLAVWAGHSAGEYHFDNISVVEF
jgi:hypothetical protein